MIYSTKAVVVLCCAIALSCTYVSARSVTHSGGEGVEPPVHCEDDLCAENCVAFTNSTYSCGQCIDGYTYNGEALNCQDIDECLKSPCVRGIPCINTPGSYICDDECNHEYCASGCKPLSSGYLCSECTSGYEYNKEHKKCVDENECTHMPCLPEAECQNSEGSYRCLCPDSMFGDGETKCHPTCDNAKECISGCYAMSETEYKCTTCAADYKYDTTTLKCEKVPECTEDNSCAEHAICAMRGGVEECSCPPEYLGDGYQICYRGLCDLHELCVDPQCEALSDGGYTCEECKPGSTYNKSTHKCEDVNECLESPCVPEATCHNVVCSFLCFCPNDTAGFDGMVDGTGCA